MPRSFLITNKRYGPNAFQCFKSNINDDNKLVFNNELIKTNKAKNKQAKQMKCLEQSLNRQLLMINQNNKNLLNNHHDDNDDDDDNCIENEKPETAATDRAIHLLKQNFDKCHAENGAKNNNNNNIKIILGVVPSTSLFQTVTNEIHACTDCGKTYSTSSNLTRHRQTHRSVTDKKARKCPHCDKIYVSMPAYSMHVRTHTQGCQCHFCGKCFSRPWLLQGHIRTHTGEKPFKCDICEKAFADKSNLRAHVQTHSLSKPFVCCRCGKAFALKSYLYKHEESSCMRELIRDKRTNRHKESTKLIIG